MALLDGVFVCLAPDTNIPSCLIRIADLYDGSCTVLGMLMDQLTVVIGFIP